MTTYIALLRGINVGGHKAVAMADLRSLLGDLGLTEPRSLLQSGNLIFRSEKRSADELERLLEVETSKRLGLDTAFMVRSAADWLTVVSRNPFPTEAERDPGHLVVMFLKEAPAQAAVKALQAAIVGRELVRADRRQAYIVYPDGIGPSRLTIAIIEKKLGTRGTGRNWNTVRKLAALVTT